MELPDWLVVSLLQETPVCNCCLVCAIWLTRDTHTHTLGNRGDIKAEVSVMRVLPASVSLSSLRLLHQQFKNPLSSSELRTVVHQSRGWIMYEYVGTATDMTQLVLIFTTLRQGLWIGWLNCYVNSTETADPWHHQDEAVAPETDSKFGWWTEKYHELLFWILLKHLSESFNFRSKILKRSVLVPPRYGDMADSRTLPPIFSWLRTWRRRQCVRTQRSAASSWVRNSAMVMLLGAEYRRSCPSSESQS